MSFGKSKEDKEVVPAVSSTSVGASPLVSSSGQAKPEAFIGKGSKIVGTLTFTGPVEIEGAVEGEIIAQDRLVVGETATVKGKISGAEIVVKGDVQGDIVASKRLSLRRPAKIVGNVTAAILSMEEGVSFEGKCSMTAGTRAVDSKPANVMSFNDKVA